MGVCKHLTHHLVHRCICSEFFAGGAGAAFDLDHAFGDALPTTTAEVAKLKREEGKDIISYGHGPLGQALLEHNLLDELHFSIHPVLVGRGKVALRDDLRARLKLIESRTLANGVVVVSYEPIRS